VENGDLGNIGRNLIVLIPLILLILFQIFFKKRRKEGTPPEIASSLLMDISLNQQIAEEFIQGHPAKKFETSSWQRNKNKLDFLDRELLVTLEKTFNMAEEFNREINAARRLKTLSYLVGIPADKLKEPLARSRQGLEQWLQSNRDQASTTPKRRSFFPQK